MATARMATTTTSDGENPSSVHDVPPNGAGIFPAPLCQPELVSRLVYRNALHYFTPSASLEDFVTARFQ